MPDTADQEHRPDRLQAFSEALETGSLNQVVRLLAELHPAEIAHLLDSRPDEDRELLWGLVPPDAGGEVLLHLNDDVRAELMARMSSDELIAVTEGLDTDDLADILPEMPEPVIQAVLRAMEDQDRLRLEAVLSFPEDTAGGLMNTDTVTVRPEITLDAVLRYLRRRGELPAATDSLIVVNRHGKYLGLLPITALLTQDASLTVAEVMQRDVVGIPATMPAHEVASLFARRDLISAPVVSDTDRLLGRITIDDVVDVIREESDQSLRGIAGLQEEEDLFAPVWRKARNRWPWLTINLLTAFIASRVIGLFEGTIAQIVALAALMPIIASVAGNTGNQTVALIIRALALDQLNPGNVRRLLMKEISVSLVNGLLWGTVVGLFAFAFYQELWLALVMGGAMMLNLLVAAFIGVGIPLMLRRMGRDPALGSSILLTATTDSMGFFIFLALATFILL